MIGLGTLALILLLSRTRLAQLSMAIALVAATVLVWVAGLDDVATLSDTTLIPDGLPPLSVPQWELVAALLPSAAGLAIIALVQGVGVSKTVSNPDGSYPNISRDFSAKGVANIASGMFAGMPVGGTMSETAVSLKAGARSRWAAIFSGGFIIVGVLLLSDVLGYLAMPAIATLLIVAGIEAIKPDRIGDVWHSGWEPRIIMVTTFVATLMLQVHEAVFLGVGLSMLHFLYVSSVDVRVVNLQPGENGAFIEKPVPARVEAGESVILMVYGNLYFAAATTLESMLPEARAGARVILRLRGIPRAGSTLVTVLEQYASKLKRGGANLVLAEVSPTLHQQLIRTGTIALCGEKNVFPEEADLFAATRQALRDARAQV
jgi:SulP family sulfate permease